MSVSPYESAIRATKKEEKDNVQRKKCNPEKCRREVQLLRDLRVWNLHLRLPEERMPLPGEQLPMRLQQVCRRTLASYGLVHRKCGRGRFDVIDTPPFERIKYQ